MADEEKAPAIITVKSTLPVNADGSAPVALWEKHDGHPDRDGGIHGVIKGEAFISGDKPVRAAETPEVLGAIRDGRLVKTEDTKAKA